MPHVVLIADAQGHGATAGHLPAGMPISVGLSHLRRSTAITRLPSQLQKGELEARLETAAAHCVRSQPVREPAKLPFAAGVRPRSEEHQEVELVCNFQKALHVSKAIPFVDAWLRFM